MSDAEETVWVVFNGEIYNFQELRAELESRGHRFRTKSDTEVIVHGYKQWGTDVFDRLNGMFGLAIWDVRAATPGPGARRDGHQADLLRRSRTAPSGSARKSAPSSRRDRQRRPDVDPIALNLFLRFRYTPSPLTIFKGSRSWRRERCSSSRAGRVRKERWYRYTPVPFSHSQAGRRGHRGTAGLYRAAVRRHLISDVPVGILLSGGLDSGLLLALMNEHGGPGRHTPSVTARPSRTMSWPTPPRRPGSSAPTTCRSSSTGRSSSESLPEIVDMPRGADRLLLDRPHVLRLPAGPPGRQGGADRPGARRAVRRLQAPSRASATASTGAELPGPVRQVLGSAIAQLPRNETLKRGVASLAVEDRLRRYQHVFSLAPGDTIDGALPRRGSSCSEAGDRVLDIWRELLPQMEQTDELGGLQLLEMRSSLPDELLMYADKLSMAHGLEVRVPISTGRSWNSPSDWKPDRRFAMARGNGCIGRSAGSSCPQRVLQAEEAGVRRQRRRRLVPARRCLGSCPSSLLDPSSLMFGLLRPEAGSGASRGPPVQTAGQPQAALQPCPLRAMAAEQGRKGATVKINICGLGYVGSVSAACLAADGHEVLGIDIDRMKVDTINAGASPIVEPGLSQLIADAVTSGRLRATVGSPEKADISFVCVGTPSNDNGSLSLTYIARATEQIGDFLRTTNSYHLVCVRSTVLPGTVETTVIPLLEQRAQKKAGRDFGVCMNPEFLREGSSIRDYYSPPFTLIGELDSRSGDILEELYSKLPLPSLGPDFLLPR